MHHALWAWWKRGLERITLLHLLTLEGVNLVASEDEDYLWSYFVNEGIEPKVSPTTTSISRVAGRKEEFFSLSYTCLWIVYSNCHMQRTAITGLEVNMLRNLRVTRIVVIIIKGASG